jgi:carboxypeptidase family protein/TonB-dependent receptor-like protein
MTILIRQDSMKSRSVPMSHLGGATRSVLLLAFSAIALARAALAQTDVTTGRISGYVRDAGGIPLAGAAVTGRNQATGHAVAATSGRDGFYQLVDLPTGTYSVTASLGGFAIQTLSGIRLILGSSPSVDLVLGISTVSERVIVTSTIPTVEATSTTVSTTIQAEQLENIPVSGRDFKSFALLTPMTRIESERGTLSIGGERGVNTSINVDGMDFNNPFFGGSAAHAEGRAPLSLSLESIQEMTVMTNGASVEFGRSGGGFLNVVTRSGTNAVHGSGFFYFQPQALVADFANGKPPNDQERKQFGGSLAGPLAKDRLFLFGSFERNLQDITIPINPSALDPAIFARYPVLASPPEYVQTRDGRVAFGRLDWQLTNSQRLMARANYADYDGVNGTNSTPNNTLQHNGIEGMKSLQVLANSSGQFGASLVNDLNFNYHNEDTPRADKGLNLPEIQVSTTALYGEVGFLPTVSTVRRYEASDTLTYLLKNHAAKVGFDYNDTSISQIFKSAWRGVFQFNSTADLLAGKYFRYSQFGGLGGLTADQAGLTSFAQREYAGFLQDQWFVNAKLTVTLGVRYEYLDNPNAPVLNPSAALPSGQFLLNGRIPDVRNQWSPRIGVSFSPDPRTALRITAGRYWSRTPGLLFSQLYSRNGLQGVLYSSGTNNAGQDPTDPRCRVGETSCYDPLAPPWGAAFDPVGVARVNLSSIPSGAPGLPVFVIDPDFTNPHTDRLTFSMEREVIRGVSAQLELTWAKGYDLQRLTDANRAYDGTVSANGQPNYYGPTARPNPFYSTITESKSDARAEYRALVFQASRRFTENFGASVSVTYSRDKDSDSNERNFNGIQAEDFNNLNGSYSWSNRDQRWRAAANAVWQSPFWGLGVAGAIRFNTGSPYTGLAGSDFNNDGQSGTDRPTLGCVPVGTGTAIDCSNGQHLDRNSFRQPSFYTVDLRLMKAIAVGPGALILALDCFNCTNTGNKFVTSTTYGRVPSRTPGGPVIETSNAGFGNANNPGTPFTGQVSVRYDF